MPIRRRLRVRRLLTLALTAGLAASCGSGSLPISSSLPRLLEERGLSPALLAPVSIDAEMKAWVHKTIPRTLPPKDRTNRLLIELLGRKKAPMHYRAGTTVSVAEAWETGHANCLTFSHLFVRLAREIGLDAYYLRVREVALFDREGDLVVAVDHVTAAVGKGVDRRILDFSDRPIRPYVETEEMSDRSALALHYSNLGAEAIRRGEIEPALESLRIATQIDPDLPDGWVNLGVALRRQGDLGAAEAAYRRAIALDAGQIAAVHNLTQLLERLGRTDDANALLDAAADESTRNPWAALGLGDLALRAGKLDEAEGFYRSAARNAAASPEPWAALGAWALASGDGDKARRYLDRAVKIEPTNARALRLLLQLESPSGHP